MQAMKTQTGMFLALHDGDEGDDDQRMPIAAESTREQAQRIGIQRTLGLGLIYGSIVVIEQTDMPADDWASLRSTLSDFAKKHGLD